MRQQDLEMDNGTAHLAGTWDDGVRWGSPARPSARPVKPSGDAALNTRAMMARRGKGGICERGRPRSSQGAGARPPPAGDRHPRLSRLRAPRQRRRAQAGALRPLHRRAARAAGAVAAGAGARRVAAGRCHLQGQQRRRGRRGRPLAQEHGRARDVAGARARHHHAVPADELPPPRHLPRAAAALGVDDRAGCGPSGRGRSACSTCSPTPAPPRCWRPGPAPR